MVGRATIGSFSIRARLASFAVTALLAVATGAFPTSPQASAQETPCPDGGEITIETHHPTWAYDEDVTYTYTVSGPGGFSDTRTITFEPGGPLTKSETVATPPSVVGDFTVLEESSAGSPNSDYTLTLESPSCEAQVAFDRSGPHVPDPATVSVIKTETSRGRTRRAIGTWSFTLNGQSLSSPITKRTNAGGNTHRVTFDDLEPETYTLCERFYRGWRSNLGNGSTGAFVGDDRSRCVAFTLDQGELRTFRVNNRKMNGSRPPPGVR